jgi:hypothetical protein
MKGRISLLLLLVLPPLNGAPVFPQEKAKPPDHKAYAYQPEGKSQTAMPPKEAVTPDNAPQECPTQQKDPTPTQKGIDYVFWGFWVNLFLVISTLLIAIFAVVQALAAKAGVGVAQNQVNILAQEVKLQEATARQWVHVREWRVWKTEQSNILMVGFKVVNPTKLFLRLDAILTTSLGGSRSDLGLAYLLIPEEPYEAIISVPASKQQVSDFGLNGLSIGFESSVLFTDAMGRQWQQVFGRILLCGGGRLQSMLETKNTLRSSEAS